MGLKKDKKFSLPGYSTYNKNRINKAMGGVATAIREDTAGFALKIAEGNEDNEFIITHHAQFTNPINVMNMACKKEGTLMLRLKMDGMLFWKTLIR